MPASLERVPVALWLNSSNPSIARDTAKRFGATAAFGDGTTEDVSALVTWTVADVAPARGVAVVDEKGRVLGKNAGQATVTASLRGQSVSTTLTVDLLGLVSLALTPSSPMIARGTTQAFTATGTFTDGSTQDVTSTTTWSVTDIAPAVDVAFINDTGEALGNREGKATVTATFLSKTDSTTLTVTAATVASLAVTPATRTLVKGDVQAMLNGEESALVPLAVLDFGWKGCEDATIDAYFAARKEAMRRVLEIDDGFFHDVTNVLGEANTTEIALARHSPRVKDRPKIRLRRGTVTLVILLLLGVVGVLLMLAR